MACQTIIGKSTPAGDLVGSTDTQTLTNKTIDIASNTITGTAWRVFYTDGSGNITQLPLGSAGSYLGSNGVSSAPTWSVPTGSGDVSKVGTPVDNQIGVWTGDGTIEGDPNFIWNGTNQVFGTGSGIVTGTGAGNTLLFRAYDVDGAAYTTFATLTANNTPTMDLSTAVTRGGITIADISSSQTLTNKSISGSSNTITNLTTSSIAAATLVTAADTIASNNNDTTIPTSAAVKAYADSVIGANDAMTYKGVIDASTNPNYPAADAGDTYKISVAGKIGGASGPNVEVGDMIICTVDSTASGNHATVGANWNIIEKNIDGAVTGPASSTSGNIATYNGTTGKVIQDSGKALPSGDIIGTTDSQTLSNKTLTTPTIGDFTNAGHNHENAAGGGQLSITNATTGTLTETRGGTGLTTYAVGDLLIGDGVNSLGKISIGLSDQVLASNGTTGAWANPKPYRPVVVTTDTAASSGTHYLTNDSVDRCIITLPGTPTAGDRIMVTAIHANGWRLQTASTDVIRFLGLSTTATTGYLDSDATNNFSSVEVVAISASEWVVTSAVGCIEIV